MSTEAPLPEAAFASRPAVRREVAMRRVGDEAVAWSDLRETPTLLDPVAVVMVDVIDGVATAAELVEDVQDALGIDRYAAWAQVKRVLDLLDSAGMLESSVPYAQPFRSTRPLLPEPDW